MGRIRRSGALEGVKFVLRTAIPLVLEIRNASAILDFFQRRTTVWKSVVLVSRLMFRCDEKRGENGVSCMKF